MTHIHGECFPIIINDNVAAVARLTEMALSCNSVKNVDVVVRAKYSAAFLTVSHTILNDFYVICSVFFKKDVFAVNTLADCDYRSAGAGSFAVWNYFSKLPFMEFTNTFLQRWTLPGYALTAYSIFKVVNIIFDFPFLAARLATLNTEPLR